MISKGFGVDAPRVELPEPYSTLVDQFQIADNSYRNSNASSRLTCTLAALRAAVEERKESHLSTKQPVILVDLGWMGNQSKKRGQCNCQASIPNMDRLIAGLSGIESFDVRNGCRFA